VSFRAEVHALLRGELPLSLEDVRRKDSVAALVGSAFIAV
jgi:hypothetical protein